MNSHQRRLARRYWPYLYELGVGSWQQHVMAIDWCKEQFGPMYKDRWHYRYISDYPPEIMFWFHCEKDAVWFKLNWL